MSPTRIEFSGSKGVTLIGHELGPHDGPVVLLAHGGGQTKRAWARTLKHLADAGYRSIAIDLRGHGESSWAKDGSYHIADFATDMLCVVDALGGHPHAVGASLGGLASLYAEGELRPGSFASLTLVDVTPTMDPAGAARIIGFMKTHLETGFASQEEAASVIADYTSNRAKRGPSDGLEHYLRRGDDGRYRWHWDPAFVANLQLRVSDNDGLMDRAVASLRLPVHLIRGGLSDLTTQEAADDLKQRVPQLVCSNIAGAGHMVAGDRNDAFAQAILGFLDSQRQDAFAQSVVRFRDPQQGEAQA